MSIAVIKSVNMRERERERERQRERERERERERGGINKGMHKKIKCR